MRMFDVLKNIGMLTACCLVLSMPATPCFAAGGDSPWMVRVRALGILPDDSSTPITVIHGKADVDNAVSLDLDFSYFFTENLAAELTLTYSRHNVSAKGTAVGDIDLGSLDILPPTLTLQYHFMPQKPFRPYLGAGVSYVLIPQNDPGAADSISYESGVFGPAIQAGFDYFFNEHWCLNIDVKKVWVNVDANVHALGTTVSTSVDVNPWLIGVGIGYRF